MKRYPIDVPWHTPRMVWHMAKYRRTRQRDYWFTAAPGEEPIRVPTAPSEAQVATAWRRYARWCRRRNVDPLNAFGLTALEKWKLLMKRTAAIIDGSRNVNPPGNYKREKHS